MRTKFLKSTAMTAGVATGAYILGIRAQSTPAPASITTDWIGCLVAGKDDSLDRLARGPFPTAVGSIEIGLRSDGVV